MQVSTTLQGMVRELRDFKVLKMGQNLHANMEGFHRSSNFINNLPKYINHRKVRLFANDHDCILCKNSSELQRHFTCTGRLSLLVNLVA